MVSTCNLAWALFTAGKPCCSPSHVLANIIEPHPDLQMVRVKKEERSCRTLTLKMGTTGEETVRKVNSWTCPRPTESESPGMGPDALSATKQSRWS